MKCSKERNEYLSKLLDPPGQIRLALRHSFFRQEYKIRPTIWQIAFRMLMKCTENWWWLPNLIRIPNIVHIYVAKQIYFLSLGGVVWLRIYVLKTHSCCTFIQLHVLPRDAARRLEMGKVDFRYWWTVVWVASWVAEKFNFLDNMTHYWQITARRTG